MLNKFLLRSKTSYKCRKELLLKKIEKGHKQEGVVDFKDQMESIEDKGNQIEKAKIDVVVFKD